MSGELVPFGKYKGKPVEVLMADTGYRDWLMAQPWFRDRFQVVYQTIVNYGGEPADTPEHSQLQASFLDDSRCLALAKLLYAPGLFDGTAAGPLLRQPQFGQYTGSTGSDLVERLEAHLWPTIVDARVAGRAFEAGGWDVVFDLSPAGLYLALKSLPPCVCICNHEADCPGGSVCRGGSDDWRCVHRHGSRVEPTLEWQRTTSLDEIRAALMKFRSHAHCNDDCVWRSDQAARWLLDDAERRYIPSRLTVRVECKPDLGDDFPAVLRQVGRHETETGDRRCVVARRHQFEQVTWEQVTEMFRASGIALIDEADLTTEAQVARPGEPAGEGRQEGARP
jgi:hypothetical protein